MRFILACMTLLAASGSSALAAKFKTIELHPDYRHDRFNTQPKDIVLKFRAYISSFDSEDDDNGDGTSDRWGIPHFVAYEIKRFEGTLGKAPKRPSTWITDKKLVQRGVAPTDSTYKYSRAFRSQHPNWFVRGHLTMKHHAWRLGANADWNTHTMFNAVPQRSRFNSPVWRELEDKTAKWADKFGSVWIITGPIINSRTPTEFLGEAQKGEMLIAIPHGLFKIVIKDSAVPDRPDVLAFKYPQDHANYAEKPYNHEEFLTSVDKIEELTGLNFLTSLPDTVEAAIESQIMSRLWD